MLEFLKKISDSLFGNTVVETKERPKKAKPIKPKQNHLEKKPKNRVKKKSSPNKKKSSSKYYETDLLGLKIRCFTEENQGELFFTLQIKGKLGHLDKENDLNPYALILSLKINDIKKKSFVNVESTWKKYREKNSNDFLWFKKYGPFDFAPWVNFLSFPTRILSLDESRKVNVQAKLTLAKSKMELLHSGKDLDSIIKKGIVPNSAIIKQIVFPIEFDLRKKITKRNFNSGHSFDNELNLLKLQVILSKKDNFVLPDSKHNQKTMLISLNNKLLNSNQELLDRELLSLIVTRLTNEYSGNYEKGVNIFEKNIIKFFEGEIKKPINNYEEIINQLNSNPTPELREDLIYLLKKFKKSRFNLVYKSEINFESGGIDFESGEFFGENSKKLKFIQSIFDNNSWKIPQYVKKDIWKNIKYTYEEKMKFVSEYFSRTGRKYNIGALLNTAKVELVDNNEIHLSFKSEVNRRNVQNEYEHIESFLNDVFKYAFWEDLNLKSDGKIKLITYRKINKDKPAKSITNLNKIEIYKNDIKKWEKQLKIEKNNFQKLNMKSSVTYSLIESNQIKKELHKTALKIKKLQTDIERVNSKI